MGSNLIGSTKLTASSFQILTKRVLIGIAAALAISYCVDYLSVRIRLIHPKPTDPFESLTSTRILAIPEKNGKTEFGS